MLVVPLHYGDPFGPLAMILCRPGPEGSNRSRRLMCRGVAIRVATQSFKINKLLQTATRSATDDF